MLRRYFDHGSTSHPKPDCVHQVVREWLESGGTYGRSAYPRVVEVSRRVEDARDQIAAAFGVTRSERVIFTPGATWSINMILQDLLSAGGRVLVSPLEHNAVMRPLMALAARGVTIDQFPAGADGRICVDEITPEWTNGATLAVVCQMSNVNGVIQPLTEIRSRLNGIPLLVDAAQSAGKVEINLDRDGMDYMAVSGHKGLLGLPGSGLLLLGAQAKIPVALIAGGTGSRSEEVIMPDFLPDALEAGTPNIPGILAMAAGASWRQTSGVDPLPRVRQLIAECENLPGIQILAAVDVDSQGPLFSFNIQGMSSSAVARQLSDLAQVDVRSGLHCAPRAHRYLGTLSAGGTVRIAPGPAQPEEDYAFLFEALQKICGLF